MRDVCCLVLFSDIFLVRADVGQRVTLVHTTHPTPPRATFFQDLEYLSECVCRHLVDTQTEIYLFAAWALQFYVQSGLNRKLHKMENGKRKMEMHFPPSVPALRINL